MSAMPQVFGHHQAVEVRRRRFMKALLFGLEGRRRTTDYADCTLASFSDSPRLSSNHTAGLSSMSADSSNRSSTTLVHEGWSHLQSQRPLAAWGSWQRALRADPECTAAQQALTTLESAADLPQAARTSYRFRRPDDPRRRAAWDERMTGRETNDLAASAELFGRLAIDDPLDSAAWYNRALCLAWQGENREAISCLDRVVGIDAQQAFDQAASAWALAGILRQGRGAEELADDLRFACTIAWDPADTATLLDAFPEIQRTAAPREPGEEANQKTEIEVFEWLDKPSGIQEGAEMREDLAELREDPAELREDLAELREDLAEMREDLAELREDLAELPRVLASVYIDARRLRLSSPRVENLQRLEETLFQRHEISERSVRREVTPLPLPFLDADVWAFRAPRQIEPARADDLRREAVEQYYENEWIHRRRNGLGDRSPLDAAHAAHSGDIIAKVKLTATVNLREQLGERPSVRGMYYGYPFDRLRRRLGLELIDSGMVDPADLGCAAPWELNRLDPAVLDVSRLIEAVRSSAGLADDTRTARLAAEIFRRKPTVMISSVDLVAAVAPLVRQAMNKKSYDAAIDWIKQAQTLADQQTRRKLEVWRAEIHARAGRADAARAIYQGLVTIDASGAALALDGAETLIDQGHAEEAEPLLIMARDLARKTGKRWIARRAQQLLG
jgi:tetratricopeptide (TPR) repeat protein